MKKILIIISLFFIISCSNTKEETNIPTDFEHGSVELNPPRACAEYRERGGKC